MRFLNFYLDKNEATFRATWRILVFSGQATMPRSLESEAAMVEFVAHTAGTIGYISRSTPHEGGARACQPLSPVLSVARC